MIFGLLIFAGTPLLDWNDILVDIFILDVGFDSLELGGEFIVLFEFILAEFFMFRLDGIFGIVECGDLEDKFFVDGCSEFICFI